MQPEGMVYGLSVCSVGRAQRAPGSAGPEFAACLQSPGPCTALHTTHNRNYYSAGVRVRG